MIEPKRHYNSVINLILKEAAEFLRRSPRTREEMGAYQEGVQDAVTQTTNARMGNMALLAVGEYFDSVLEERNK